MITLAIDTTEKRGSAAVVRDRLCLAAVKHPWELDYSAWLLPAVQKVLAECQTKIEQFDLLAVATGPGSFTGLRVGLTTVKAWAEVYGKPIAGVSRLEAMARSVPMQLELVAASYDGQRGQLFCALYRQVEGRMLRVGDELVAAPEEFISLVDGEAGRQTVGWVCLAPGLIQDSATLQSRLKTGDQMVVSPDELAPAIAILGEERASQGKLSNSLELDANYVRRSDAEIFWKDSGSRGR
jgi:tRNA threonylcarbamoyladenosine biosynthesis protein TsaB